MAGVPLGCRALSTAGGLRPGRGRLLAVALLASAAASADEAPKKAVVNTVRARQTCIKENVRLSGFVVPRDERALTIQAPGYRVSEILVAEGDKVAANQELLRAVRAGGDDQGAQGPGAAASQLPPTMALRSPIAGVVTRIAVEVGAVTGSMPAAAMSMPGMPPEPQMRVSGAGADLLVDIPSLYATQIRKGSPVLIVRQDGREVPSTVRVPVSFINPASQLGQARIAVDHGSALRAGRFASAIIETARDCGVVVPRAAVTAKGDVSSVQVLTGSSVETRPIKTGLSEGADVQVLEGLAEGEQVVAAAGTAVKPGDPVVAFPQTDAERAP